MSNVSAIVNNTYTYEAQNVKKANEKAEDAAKDSRQTKSKKTEETDKTSKSYGKSNVTGKTIGTPQLSEKAAKYYEKLKSKYNNMEFILVSEDQKENAKAQAGRYANANKMVVLVDEDKIERMAEDEAYREKYEGIIRDAATGLSKMKESVAGTRANVKGFGMQVDDNGTASYFAVLEKSSAAQKERIEKNIQKKAEAKKAEEKKAKKEEQEERLKSKGSEKTEKNGKTKESDTVTVTASSLEELVTKISDKMQEFMSDRAITDAEKQVGRNVDFSI